MALGRRKPADPPCIGCDEDGNPPPKVMTEEDGLRHWDWMAALRDAGIHGDQRGERKAEPRGTP